MTAEDLPMLNKRNSSITLDIDSEHMPTTEPGFHFFKTFIGPSYQNPLHLRALNVEAQPYTCACSQLISLRSLISQSAKSRKAANRFLEARISSQISA